MLKNIIKLEIQIGNKVYNFLCDNDAPLEHVKEALFQFTKYAGQVEDQIRQQQEAQKQSEENKKVEPIAEGENVQS